MTNGQQKRTGAGLALSGGGFRATLFHLGALTRLNELGWLPGLKDITSVSGGSIAAAYLGYKWKKLTFDAAGVATNFKGEVVLPVQAFCRKTIDIPATLKGWANPFSHPSEQLSKVYATELFKDATLQSLPGDAEGPRFTIYGTNLQTGVSVRLSRPYLADYRLGMIENPTVTLADAVAVSSAFPPLFVPMTLRFKAEQWKNVDGADLFNEVSLRTTMKLGDGGIYDNMGLERIWDVRDPVLVSDGGSPFAVDKGEFWLNWSHLARTVRTLDIVVEQTRRLRRRQLIAEYNRPSVGGTFWGIATRICDYKLKENGFPDAIVVDNEVTMSMRTVPTRLKSFDNKLQGQLINWGYALADAGMRRYVLQPGAKPGVLPVPEYPLS